MKAIVAFPSTARFGQEAARAFYEVGALEAFMTTFAFQRSGWLGRTLSTLPGRSGERILVELERRAITEVPWDKVEMRPWLEILRTGAAKAGLGVQTVDKIWDRLSRDFTGAVGRRLSSQSVGAIYAYEYTALEAFEAAEQMGKAKILDFPSLNSRQFEKLLQTQKEAYPELRGVNDSYFESLFETRQARRDAEMSSADVIITNSSVTRQSHIKGGADPRKTFAVPYGAPPPRMPSQSYPNLDRPLRVVWAGTFSIRKGAHYFVSAWRDLGTNAATADIYGSVVLPERLWKPVPDGLMFHGSVVRSVLFDAFWKADVLVFPTLSDGFGMVVTEAFACGLPVMTTDQAGASDLVEHGKNGLIIEAANTTAITNALNWCLDNRRELALMRGAAVDTARKWQWPHYRSALRKAVNQGLQQAGYSTTDLVMSDDAVAEQ